MSYLGVDLGTSGLRALLVDADGAPIGSAESYYAVSNPASGWSEQDPSDWLAALDEVVAKLSSNHSAAFKALRGIGVAGHMHGATLLDDAGDVLRPCILWNDTRSEAEAAELDQTTEVRELSANIVFPGFTAPKLVWVKNNESETFEKVAKVLLPAAYLNYHLTGEYVADRSDSSGTSWLDVKQRAWSDLLLKASTMSLDQMPNLVEGSETAGVLRSELKSRWGLTGEVVVCGGAGDNAAAACGIGALREGDGFVSLGTSGVVLAARDSFNPAPDTALHTFCHAVPDQWYQMGVMLSATDSLNWLSRIMATPPADLTKALGTDLKAPGDVRFLPYLSGERTPHNDARIRGAFTGLSMNSDKEELTRAVIEGVSFGLKDSLDALKSTGAKIDALTAIGGGSASGYWLNLLATVLDVPLKIPTGREFGAALGAARLAMIAATGASPSDIVAAPETGFVMQPNSDLTAAFADAYQAFRTAYPAVKNIQ
ncbi:xylulokinase [Shimia sagamensis]|uniref:Xylulose kinase n=1 Tax=Shimia sagamensis TaxID=1566352 RepID=A0ABY1NUF2_9RHOB|nr:xylulokinase [Shimia sagamensis]SMP18651.1 xylulokinase [Shimia sagamensis]